MAEYTMDVQDRASVEAWKEKAQALNERADRTIREAAQALNEFKDTAEGNVFDEVVKYSDGIVTGMTKVLEGMNEILTAVNSILEKIANLGKELVDGALSVVSKVLG